jgi:hypothetical protein
MLIRTQRAQLLLVPHRIRHVPRGIHQLLHLRETQPHRVRTPHQPNLLFLLIPPQLTLALILMRILPGPLALLLLRDFLLLWIINKFLLHIHMVLIFKIIFSN